MLLFLVDDALMTLSSISLRPSQKYSTIELKHTVQVTGKATGLNLSTRFILSELEKCDTSYPIAPFYTYSTENLDDMIAKTKTEYQNAIDNLDAAIAAPWLPNTFGYIYVEDV